MISDDQDNDRKAKAREEWAKFERVAELLQTVNDYMSIYSLNCWILGRAKTKTRPSAKSHRRNMGIA
jgi:hypothetical protein